jgi:outer membrane translocation and assembly module TamA
MSNGDKIQKQMEFIVDQQAQFASDIGQLKDVVARFANASLKRIEDLEEKSSALVDAQIRSKEKASELVDAQIKSEERASALVDSQIKSEGKISALAEAQTKSERKISALAEAQAHTDQRLNTLITVVERYISRDQNGNAQG